MSTEFALRKKCIIAAVIASAILVAFFWAGLSREDIARSANVGLVGLRSGSQYRDSRTEVPTTSYHGSQPKYTGGVEKPLSRGSDTMYAFPGYAFGASQWPQQSAGAYCALPSSNGVSTPIGGMIEKRWTRNSLTGRETVGSYNCGIQRTTEPCDTSSLWQSRWNEFHQHSPTSQGSVMVNF